jgi:8-oxo-dGTP pyrophosphatase MutT (NUDIX family)
MHCGDIQTYYPLATTSMIPTALSSAVDPNSPNDMSLHTLRADTLKVLREWSPVDTEQEQLRLAYVDFVDSFDNSVDRSCRVGHVTASGLLVDTTTGEVLLTLHARIGRWLQLGGHIEPETDSSLLDAALRECREESGIDSLTIDPVPLRLDRHEVPCSDGLGGRARRSCSDGCVSASITRVFAACVSVAALRRGTRGATMR